MKDDSTTTPGGGQQVSTQRPVTPPKRLRLLASTRRDTANMDFQGIAVTASLVVSFVTLALLVVQTRSLSAQTRAVAKSLEYGAYLKLVDYLNDVNLELMGNPELKRVFIDMDVLNQHLATVPDLSIEQVALA